MIEIINLVSEEAVTKMIEKKNNGLIMDAIIELLRLDDLTEYKEVISKVVQYVYDFMHVGNYEQVIYFSEPIKKLLKKESCPLVIDEYYDFSTLICYLLDDYEGALKEFDEYYDQVIKENYSFFYHSSICNYAITNFKLNKIDRAKELVDELMEMLKEDPDSKIWYVLNLTRAEILMAEDQMEDVYDILIDSLNNPEIDFIIGNKISLYVLFSQYFEKTGDMTQAITWYDKSIILIEENELEYSEKKIYKEFAALLYKAGEFKRSADSYSKFVELTEEAIKKNRKLMQIKSELEVYIKQKDDEAYHLSRENEKIKILNNQDYLTGIYNKRYLFGVIEDIFNSEQEEEINLFVFDIDRFKTINDSYGHLVGDYVIKTMCNNITAVLNPKHIFARTGGDEFMICFVGLSKEQAKEAAEMVFETVKNNVIAYENLEIVITISGGLSGKSDEDIQTANQLLALSDQKLYRSKALGRSKITT